MAKAPTFMATMLGYANMWKSMKVTRVTESVNAASRIIELKPRYEKVERATGVPWFFVGIIHMREASNNFGGVLHNGEHIIGTGKKTKLVPAGRGPFNTWEEAAVDALKLKGLHKVDWKVNLISRIGYHGEEFNGWGYTWKGINSPYLWAGSNHQQPGKYVADHKWDPNAIDKQLGIMPVLAKIAELDSSVDARLKAPNPPAKANTAIVAGGVAAAGAAGTVVATKPEVVTDPGWVTAIPVVLIVIAIVAVGYFLIRRFK